MSMEKIVSGLLLLLVLIGCTPKENARLTELAAADQLDRKQDNPMISKNDVDRLTEVREIVESDKLYTSQDYYNAALIYQHGNSSEDFQTANELAQKAVEIDPENQEANVMIAQSMDRYLLSIGKPQVYGTQRTLLGTLEYLRPIDTLAVTDAERKALGVHSIQKLLDYFNRKHQKNKTNLLDYVPSDSLLKAHEPRIRVDLIGTFEELVAKVEYPAEASENHISGKVLVEFTITPEGNTENIFVVEGIGYGCDEEAKRVIGLAKYKNYMNKSIDRRVRIPFGLD